MLRQRLFSVAVIAVPVTLALVIGSLGIGADPLWYDELFTADASSRGISGLLEHLWAFPTVPYMGLILVWTISGAIDADWWLRVPSLIAVGVATAFTARTGVLLGGAKVGVSAGLLVAFNPLIIRYAQEARPYAVGTAIAALCLWLAVRWSLQPTRSTWIGLLVSVLFLALFFAPGLVVLVPLSIFLVIGRREGRLVESLQRTDTVLAAAAFLLLVVFSIFSYLHRGEAMHGWLAVPTLNELANGPAMLGYSLGAVLFIFALLSRAGSIWLLGVVVGVMAIWIVSQMGSSWWLERSFITLTLPLALAVASVAARASWAQVTAAASLLALLVLPSVVSGNLQREEGRTEADKALSLAGLGGRGDVVVVGERPSLQFALERYAGDLSLDIRTTPNGYLGAFYSADNLEGYNCELVLAAEAPVNWWRCGEAG